jgi:D-glycero-alpha-D-manno-heptose 1-phosphate guanylyltransferase
MQVKEAIILAGGLGTRLQSTVPDLPKPLAPVAGKPFLEYLLKYLNHYGFTRVIISVGYMADKIKNQFGASYENLKIKYAEEKTKLGTGGALKFALRHCESDHVLVLNGDSFFEINLQDFFFFHSHYSGMFSIATRLVENAARYGTIETEEDEIIAFREKTGENKPGLINCGVYIVDHHFFIDNCPDSESFSLETDFLSQHLNDFGFFAYAEEGYFIDIGIPEDYERAQHEFERFKYQ